MQSVPYACLFIAFLLIYVPRFFVARAQAQDPKGYDNRHPRAQQATLTGLGIRAVGAHNNSFEAFAPFAAGVLVCMQTGVAKDTVPLLCIAFVALRGLYIALYLGDKAIARSSVWTLGFLVCCTLLVLPLLG